MTRQGENLPGSAVDSISARNAVKSYLLDRGYYLSWNAEPFKKGFAHDVQLYSVRPHPSKAVFDLSFIRLEGIKGPLLRPAEVYIAQRRVLHQSAPQEDKQRSASVSGTGTAVAGRNVILLLPDGMAYAQERSGLPLSKVEEVTLYNEAGNLYAEALFKEVRTMLSLMMSGFRTARTEACGFII